MGKSSEKNESDRGEEIPFYKKQEFLVYKFWKSLPQTLKKLSREHLIDRMGIEDEEHLDLLAIKTQTQFTEKYGLSKDTLTKWNKYIYKHGNVLTSHNEWSSRLVGNIVSAIYNSALQRDPKAHSDRKLFLQLHGWVEKTEQKNTHEVKGLFDYLKQLNGGKSIQSDDSDGESVEDSE